MFVPKPLILPGGLLILRLDYAAPGAENDIDRVRTMFETNIFGVMRMVAEFVELLVTTKGQILNIGSVNAIVPCV